ncbi:MAG: hypothetical protein STSR0004_21900 [Peptococcaceae bacterium]
MCVKETRRVDNGFTFSLDKTYYRIKIAGKTASIPPKAKITALKSNRIGLKAEYNGSVYDVMVLEELPKKETKIKKQSKKQHMPVKPAPDHPWRIKPSRYVAASFYEESDREILEALYSSRLTWR